VALTRIDVTSLEGDVVATLEIGERARVVAVGTGAALGELADGASTGWVQIDPRIQIVAQ